MKFHLILFAALTFVLIFGCAAVQEQAKTASNPQVNDAQTQPSVAPENQTAAPAPAKVETQPAQEAKVLISSFSFQPAEITITQGQSVTWTNQDPMAHSVKSSAFTSPDLQNGESFSFKFETKGTFDYNCGIHPGMKGKVIVN